MRTNYSDTEKPEQAFITDIDTNTQFKTNPLKIFNFKKIARFEDG